jgi:hypothetical protein
VGQFFCCQFTKGHFLNQTTTIYYVLKVRNPSTLLDTHAPISSKNVPLLLPSGGNYSAHRFKWCQQSDAGFHWFESTATYCLTGSGISPISKYQNTS